MGWTAKPARVLDMVETPEERLAYERAGRALADAVARINRDADMVLGGDLESRTDSGETRVVPPQHP